MRIRTVAGTTVLVALLTMGASGVATAAESQGAQRPQATSDVHPACIGIGSVIGLGVDLGLGLDAGGVITL